MLRDEFYFDGLNCNPEAFDLECELLNQQYHKNQRYDEIKCHHYIISHDPMDVADHGLTGEQAQAIGMEYAEANFPGHQALVCTHTDGSNNSGNIHTHIIINSLRKEDIAPQPYTERAIDRKAGYKHHLTKEYLRHLQGSLMDICQREGLYQVDLLSPAAEKITQQEYHAQRRGQLNLDMANMEIMAEGIAPMKTKFETNKEKIRNAINDIAERAKSFEEFQRLLKAEYGIQVKDHRGRFSYLTSDRQKYISARKLGSHYDREYLLQLFEENALAAEQNQAQWAQDDPITILFIKSDLRLVVDLQNCIKAQQSRAYAQKVKISNLQQMAKTVAYIQEHGYDTQKKLQDTTDTIQSKMAKARSDAKLTEAKLKKVNEQIHYLGDMDKLYTGSSLIMYSFAAEVTEYQNTFSPAEVGEVFRVPLEFFLHTEPKCYVTRARVEPGEDFPYELICGGRDYNWRSRKEKVCFYQYEGHVIWGLTAKMMRAFTEVIR